jgi:hypothetical protein
LTIIGQLKNLEEDSVYYFIAGYEQNERKYFTQEKKFRTAPKNKPFTFVAGGDMGRYQNTILVHTLHQKYGNTQL